MGKLLLMVQVCNGDVKAMADLMSLVCDLRTANEDNSDVVVIHKPDVRRLDGKFIAKLNTKFDSVVLQKGTRWASGWPLGPNALVMDAFAYTHKMHEGGFFNYSAAMLIESDCVPLKTTWIDDIIKEWEEGDQLVLGHMDGARHHINGNLAFHPKLFDHVPEMTTGVVPSRAWDMEFWDKIKPFARASRVIHSDYRLGTSDNPWKGCGDLWKKRVHVNPDHPLANEELEPSWLHGVKTPLGLECVRARFLQKSS